MYVSTNECSVKFVLSANVTLKGLSDERGFYLPLYETDTVIKLISLEFEKANNFASQFFKE